MDNHLQHKPHVAQSYCFKEHIYIYPVPLNKKSYKLEVSYKGCKPKVSENIYSKDGARDKIWEMYEYFYDKRE